MVEMRGVLFQGDGHVYHFGILNGILFAVGNLIER